MSKPISFKRSYTVTLKGATDTLCVKANGMMVNHRGDLLLMRSAQQGYGADASCVAVFRTGSWTAARGIESVESAEVA